MISFAFFGTGAIARRILEELEQSGLSPALTITSPDRPQGRSLQHTPSPVAEWANEHTIETLKPEKIDADVCSNLEARNYPIFIVADYGMLLPKKLLDIPPRGVINVHPSLLPRLRGPSPIRTAILNNEKETGVTIMLLDEEMDHGPIIAQKKISIEPWPPRGSELDEILAREGGKLLAHILPEWLAGTIEAHEQNHDLATYSHMIRKEDGLLNLSDDPYANLLKIRAFEGWPGTYAFFERQGKRIRVQILDAHSEHGRLVIDRVKPEGKKEMDYRDFERSGAKPIA